MKKIYSSFYLVLITTSGLLFQVACSGKNSASFYTSATSDGGSSSKMSKDTLKVIGKVQLNDVASASVKVSLVNTDGSSGLPVGDATTDQNGNFSVEEIDPKFKDSCILLQVTGGTYENESSNVTSTISVDNQLQALICLDDKVNKAQVSILSSLAAYEAIKISAATNTGQCSGEISTTGCFADKLENLPEERKTLKEAIANAKDKILQSFDVDLDVIPAGLKDSLASQGLSSDSPQAKAAFANIALAYFALKKYDSSDVASLVDKIKKDFNDLNDLIKSPDWVQAQQQATQGPVATQVGLNKSSLGVKLNDHFLMIALANRSIYAPDSPVSVGRSGPVLLSVTSTSQQYRGPIKFSSVPAVMSVYDPLQGSKISEYTFKEGESQKNFLVNFNPSQNITGDTVITVADNANHSFSFKIQFDQDVNSPVVKLDTPQKTIWSSSECIGPFNLSIAGDVTVDNVKSDFIFDLNPSFSGLDVVKFYSDSNCEKPLEFKMPVVTAQSEASATDDKSEDAEDKNTEETEEGDASETPAQDTLVQTSKAHEVFVVKNSILNIKREPNAAASFYLKYDQSGPVVMNPVVMNIEDLSTPRLFTNPISYSFAFGGGHTIKISHNNSSDKISIGECLDFKAEVLDVSGGLVPVSKDIELQLSANTSGSVQFYSDSGCNESNILNLLGMTLREGQSSANFSIKSFTPGYLTVSAFISPTPSGIKPSGIKILPSSEVRVDGEISTKIVRVEKLNDKSIPNAGECFPYVLKLYEEKSGKPTTVESDLRVSINVSSSKPFALPIPAEVYSDETCEPNNLLLHSPFVIEKNKSSVPFYVKSMRGGSIKLTPHPVGDLRVFKSEALSVNVTSIEADRLELVPDLPLRVNKCKKFTIKTFRNDNDKEAPVLKDKTIDITSHYSRSNYQAEASFYSTENDCKANSGQIKSIMIKNGEESAPVPVVYVKGPAIGDLTLEASDADESNSGPDNRFGLSNALERTSISVNVDPSMELTIEPVESTPILIDQCRNFVVKVKEIDADDLTGEAQASQENDIVFLDGGQSPSPVKFYFDIEKCNKNITSEYCSESGDCVQEGGNFYSTKLDSNTHKGAFSAKFIKNDVINDESNKNGTVARFHVDSRDPNIKPYTFEAMIAEPGQVAIDVPTSNPVVDDPAKTNGDTTPPPAPGDGKALSEVTDTAGTADAAPATGQASGAEQTPPAATPPVVDSKQKIPPPPKQAQTEGAGSTAEASSGAGVTSSSD